MKKCISVLTSLALLLGTMAFAVMGAAETDVDFLYTVKGGQVVLESYIGVDEDVVIPEKIENNTVTTLASTLFEDFWEVDSVTVPASVTTIEDGALDVSRVVFCSAGSAAETYADENYLLYCVDNVLHDPYDDTTTPMPVSVAVSKAPDQTFYQDGSNFFNLTGLELTFTFADKHTDTWICQEDENGDMDVYYQEYMIDFMPDVESSVVSINYLSRKTTVELEFRENPVESIHMEVVPTMGNYQSWKLQIVEKDGSKRTVTGENSDIVNSETMDGMTQVTLLCYDNEYGPVLAQVMWGQQNQTTVCAVAYMNGMDMRTTLQCDVSGDGETTAADALIVLQASTKKVTLTQAQQTLADLNGDGDVTAADALIILQACTRKFDLNIRPGDFSGDDWVDTDIESMLA